MVCAPLRYPRPEQLLNEMSQGRMESARRPLANRYIGTLIAAMHRYASPSPDARELVAELEFVWDQVKSNVPSSSEASTSPFRNQRSNDGARPSMPGAGSSITPMRMLNSTSQDDIARGHVDSSDNNVDNEDEEDEEEEFVDAQDSQYQARPSVADRRGSNSSSPAASAADRRWRLSVEKALVRLTAEVAALREQLEARRLFRRSRSYGILSWLTWLVRSVIRAAVVDLMVLCAVLVWWKWRGGGKWEAVVWRWISRAQKRAGNFKLPGMPEKSN